MMKPIRFLLSMTLVALLVHTTVGCGDEKKKTGETSGTTPTTVFMVGDSTMCSFADKYYYPRYGFGTQLANYMNTNVTVTNLAVSGISSKTFLAHANYTTLTTNIKSGDYLIIGFGHNDEGLQGADADETDTSSFQYYIYSYVKFAKDKGAIPILITPIVRRDSSGAYANGSSKVHYMGAATGDYVAAIKKVADKYSVPCIDLTTLTKEVHLALGVGTEGTPATAAPWTPSVLPTGTVALQAWNKNMVTSIDDTHTNIYGAKYNAYLFANALKSSSSPLKNYVLANIAAPVITTDLVANSSYVIPVYVVPTVKSTTWTTSGSWWGSVFGDTGTISSTNYGIAESGSVVTVRSGVSPTTVAGKLGSTEGIAFYFQKLPVNTNFTLSATAKVKWVYYDGKKQTSFGLMVRDAVLIDTTDGTFTNASVAVGTSKVDASATAAATTGATSWMRNASGVIESFAAVSSVSVIPATNTVVNMSIKKEGNVYTCTYGTETPVSYTINLVDLDSNYIYAGLFTARGCEIDYSSVTLTIQ